MPQPEDKSATSSTPAPSEGLSPFVTRLADRLLDRYVAVWLWSVLFGTTVGLAYSYMNYRGDRWGILAVLPTTLLLI